MAGIIKTNEAEAHKTYVENLRIACEKFSKVFTVKKSVRGKIGPAFSPVSHILYNRKREEKLVRVFRIPKTRVPRTSKSN